MLWLPPNYVDPLCQGISSRDRRRYPGRLLTPVIRRKYSREAGRHLTWGNGVVVWFSDLLIKVCYMYLFFTSHSIFVALYHPWLQNFTTEIRKCYKAGFSFYLSLFFPETKCEMQADSVAQIVKNLPTMWETWVWSLGWKDLLKKEMATHSSILA